jgi:hypothetical protein
MRRFTGQRTRKSKKHRRGDIYRNASSGNYSTVQREILNPDCTYWILNTQSLAMDMTCIRRRSKINLERNKKNTAGHPWKVESCFPRDGLEADRNSLPSCFVSSKSSLPVPRNVLHASSCIHSLTVVLYKPYSTMMNLTNCVLLSWCVLLLSVPCCVFVQNET